MTATASAVTATADEDLDECGPQLIGKLEVLIFTLPLRVQCCTYPPTYLLDTWRADCFSQLGHRWAMYLLSPEFHIVLAWRPVATVIYHGRCKLHFKSLNQLVQYYAVFSELCKMMVTVS